MPAQIDESKLTDRYQTTVPESVRKALNLSKRDRIRYVVQPNGSVLMTRAPETADDPVIGKFLKFLARDLEAHPERLKAVDPGFVTRVRDLVGQTAIDLETPLSDKDE